MTKHDSVEPEEGSRRKRSYTIQSVVRAVDILNAFTTTSEILDLRVVAARTGLHKATAFRLLETLVETRMLERAGKQGYRSSIQVSRSRRFRIGYASQSNLLPFTATVTDGLVVAANAANVDLLIANNEFSPRIALQNADKFIAEKVDLVVDSQINVAVAAQIAAKFSDARIPFIALDIPHPGAVYFGADNYKAGRMAGRHLAKWATRHWKANPEQLILLGVDVAGSLLNARLTGIVDGIGELLPGGRNLPTHHYDTKGGQFEATLDLVRKHLRRKRPERALVGAVNDSTALAALQAFREAGLERACAIAGQDGSLAAREEMRRSSSRLVCSVAYFPETYGAQIIQLALDILRRKPVAPAVFVQHELLTPENVNKIYPNDAWMKRAPDRV
ncbi:substrate-binding domain-containing protein [Silvibacterium dinghuense]|uniref:LacI family transcriptional regulator n=1 Tax=Silvibacterium dinghuense TaxID=1560006 RepID=A0A4Q1S9N5_9BACT|nr:substrate-binding domain-containing protein [Silvibacterium dinghuense]RXS93651.1 LacI family transcriptional regulator [Silvibacterium dinghuense]GGH06466.1 sugar ABC transporter substrate-binding protein [Silvibacterium dinghuense]